MGIEPTRSRVFIDANQLVADAPTVRVWLAYEKKTLSKAVVRLGAYIYVREFMAI